MSIDTAIRPPYTPITLSGRIGVTTRTLTTMRREGRGPDWFRVGHSIRYEFETVERWITENRNR